MFACREFEVPVLLLTVAETEAMVFTRVWVVGTVPVKLNGIVSWNSPPKVWELALSNHRAATWLTSEVNVDVVKLKPVAGLNVTFTELRLRVVEYPTMTTEKPDVVSLVI